MTLNTGLIINGRYRIAKLLGEGGFGAVYQAWDLNLDQLCALKMNLDTSQEAQRQFQKEAAVLAKLSHPNLPRVTDRFFVQGQGQFLVMDFVEGDDLESMMSKGAIQPEQAIAWIGQVADALNYLHNQPQPIIHRDIKPANIRVTPNGRAVLVDFGLVKVYDKHLKTTIGARAVTPGYSPPEQYGRGSTDAQTDIYALAATLYTLLTSEEPPESIQRIVEDTLKPVTQVNSSVGAEVEQAIGQAMSLTPSQRYGTVLDFTAALQEVKKPAQEVATQQVQSTQPSQPNKDVELERLYQQAKAASYQKDWVLLEKLSVDIQNLDSTYRTIEIRGFLSHARRFKKQKHQSVSQGGGNNNWGWWAVAGVMLVILVGYGVVSASQEREAAARQVAARADATYEAEIRATETAVARATDIRQAEIAATTEARATATRKAEITATAEARATATRKAEITATAEARREIRITATAAARATVTRQAEVATDHAISIFDNTTILLESTDGELLHVEDGYIEIYDAGVDIRDFVAVVTFSNPYAISTGTWSSGFMFRDHGNQKFLLSIASDKSWCLRSMEGEEWSTCFDSGSVPNLDTTVNGSNDFLLVAQDDSGYLFVNGEFIAELNLSRLEDKGDVAIVIGLAEGDEIDGKVTRYEDFTVWRIDK